MGERHVGQLILMELQTVQRRGHAGDRCPSAVSQRRSNGYSFQQGSGAVIAILGLVASVRARASLRASRSPPSESAGST